MPPRKKKAEVPAIPKEDKIIVSNCYLHGNYICSPLEIPPVCPCCECGYGNLMEERNSGINCKVRDYRYIVIPEVEEPMLAGDKDQFIIVPVHDEQKFIEVEFHNQQMLCPCCCCLRDVQLKERYGKNIDSELEFERNVDILIQECNKKVKVK